jgi:hypothetical protein
LLDFTLAYTYMIHICFCLFWWWALFAAFRCASLRCFEAQGQCSRRVVVACGHLTQWAVGTVGWLPQSLGAPGGGHRLALLPLRPLPHGAEKPAASP